MKFSKKCTCLNCGKEVDMYASQWLHVEDGTRVCNLPKKYATPNTPEERINQLPKWKRDLAGSDSKLKRGKKL